MKAKYFTQRGDQHGGFHGQTVDGFGRVHPVYRYQTAQMKIRRHVRIRGNANP